MRWAVKPPKLVRAGVGSSGSFVFGLEECPHAGAEAKLGGGLRDVHPQICWEERMWQVKVVCPFWKGVMRKGWVWSLFWFIRESLSSRIRVYDYSPKTPSPHQVSGWELVPAAGPHQRELIER